MSIAINAIKRSIEHNEIVTIEACDPEDMDTLSAESEDSASSGNGRIMEYWGTDERGNEWRVHVRR